MERRGVGDLGAVVKERHWVCADSAGMRDSFDVPSRRRQLAYTQGMSFSTDQTSEKLYVQLKAARRKGRR